MGLSLLGYDNGYDLCICTSMDGSLAMDKITYCPVCREEMEYHECEMCKPDTEAEKARTEQEIGNYMDSLGSEGDE